jgi:putative endopeptidase
MANFKRIHGAILVGLVLCFWLIYLIFIETRTVNEPSGIDLSAIDTDTRPQADFYQYANGGWLSQNEVTDDSFVDAFTQLQADTQTQLQNLFEDGSLTANLTPKVREIHHKLLKFYSEFLDIQTRDELATTPLKQELDRIEQIDSYQALAKYIARSRQIGVISPWMPFITVNDSRTHQYQLSFWQAGLSLQSKSFYFDQTELAMARREQLLTYLESLFDLLEHTHPEEAAKAVLTVEMRLATAYLTPQQLRLENQYGARMDLKEIPKSLRGFPWKTYMNALGLPQLKKVYLHQEQYIKGISTMYRQLPLSDWKAYMIHRLCHRYLEFLHEDAVALYQGFFERHSDKNQEHQALKTINELMPHDLGRVFVEVYGQEEAITKATNMAYELKQHFINRLRSVSWLTIQHHPLAQEKLDNLTLQVGKPDRWPEPLSANLSEQGLVANLMRLEESAFKQEAQYLGKKGQSELWVNPPQSIYSYYDAQKNSLMVPLTLLQPPFFNTDSDDAVNYGAIGTLMVHMMGHSILAEGKEYSSDGRHKTWWSQKDLNLLNQKLQPLVNQLNAFEPLEGYRVQGAVVSEELFLDVLGLTVSLEALSDRDNYDEIKRLDNLTTVERFFLGYASIWRRQESPIVLLRHLQYDKQAPAKYRVNGALSHIPEFYKTYELNERDAMYLAPEDRLKP